MSPTGEGRELLVTLAYPLPLAVAGALMRAVGACAEGQRYTDVCIDNQGRITAQPERRARDE